MKFAVYGEFVTTALALATPISSKLQEMSGLQPPLRRNVLNVRDADVLLFKAAELFPVKFCSTKR